VVALASLRNDLAFFKEQRLIQDPGMTVEKIIDASFAEQARPLSAARQVTIGQHAQIGQSRLGWCQPGIRNPRPQMPGLG
jgi:hypothetical protein